MATFGWSYSSNFSGSKRPRQDSRKVEQRQKNGAVTVSSIPLHPQSHSAETLSAGKKFRYDHRARLYVGNLSVDTNEVTLAEHFSTFGELIGVKIVKDHENGSSRGFGFVTFDCVENAEKAKTWFAYNRLKINGREIRVKSAEKRIPFKDRATPESEKKAAQRFRNSPTLYWEYKWSDEINAEIYGPYETNLMLQWSKSGYFNSGCWVRQVDPQALNEESELETDVGENKRLKLMLDYSDSSSDSDDEYGNTHLTRSEDKRDGEDKDDFSDGKKSTDFIHVSEIDLSLYP